ncbi:CAP domain-containing protein [Paenibacillus sp. GCM10012306]|uniref:CAP domain-containing protein n=1 Tax=Paenibacillus sp. GCM10012306 TaxID=3317342 RepID=UPI0036084458
MIVIAALVLVTACSSNHSANNQMSVKQTKVETRARHGASASTLTQASSISTDAPKDSILRAKQAQVPGDVSDLLGGLLGNNTPTERTPTQTAYPQSATNPEPSANVQHSSSPQQSPYPGNSANPGVSGDSSQFVQQVLNLVNQERTKAGLKSLSLNNALSKMALAKAQDMYDNNYFDHQSPTYGSPFDMMKAFGITYNSAGENIANGQTSPEEVMNQWMNSPGHRANILNSSFTDIGIGYYNKEWVQEFTG